MRLYWENSYQNTFTSEVEKAWSEGSKNFVILSESLFYPNAGGQPCDTGFLNGLTVQSVHEELKGEGSVVHQVERPLNVGEKIKGEIDWSMRFCHMQRHTAEHILGQAFLRLFNLKSLAVNMSNPVCTMDFDGTISPDQMAAIENEVNRVVVSNLTIKAFFVDEQELGQYPVRRTPKVVGTIRLVQIGDYDVSACGGTHVNQTGEIGLIKILKQEKYKSGSRIFFVSGSEALQDYASKHAVIQRISVHLSSPPLEIEKPIGNLQVELHKAKSDNYLLREELAERVMQDLLSQFGGNEESITIASVVSDVVLDRVAKKLAEWPNVLALLIAIQEEKARYILFKHHSRPEKLDELFALALAPQGARGGGALLKMGMLPPKNAHFALESFEKILGLR